MQMISLDVNSSILLMENFIKNLSQKLITMIYMYQAALLWIRISEKLRVKSTIGIKGIKPNLLVFNYCIA